MLNEAHVPCAPVKTAREVARDPHLEARGSGSTSITKARRTRVPISPIRLHTGGKSEIHGFGSLLRAQLRELVGFRPAIRSQPPVCASVGDGRPDLRLAAVCRRIGEIGTRVRPRLG